MNDVSAKNEVQWSVTLTGDTRRKGGGVMFKRSSCWKATNVNAEPRFCELQGANRVGNTRSIAARAPPESKATQKNASVRRGQHSR